MFVIYAEVVTLKASNPVDTVSNIIDMFFIYTCLKNNNTLYGA